MMFLPGLVLNGELKKAMRKLRSVGITARGAFGEGTQAEGYVFQISNERTLGVSEMELLEQMNEVTHHICELEKAARENLLQKSERELKDRCMRAYGLLRYCEMMDGGEFVARIGDVKLGIALGFLESDGFEELHDFIDGMRPMTFRCKNGMQYAGETDCNVLRAETVRKVLPRIVWVAK